MSSHERPELRMRERQHPLGPGGRLPHPGPPHVPHAAVQQTLPFDTPVVHPGSPTAAAAEVLGEAVGECVAVTDGDTAMDDEGLLVVEAEAVGVMDIDAVTDAMEETDMEGVAD